MSFCPNCNYFLDISNNITDKFKGGKTKLDNDNKFIDLFMNGNNNIYNIGELIFNEKKLKSNKKYKKLSNENKTKLYSIFTSIKNKKSSVYLICNNCNYLDILKSNTILFEDSVIKTSVEDLTILNLRKDDKTLPRTKDYICPNTKCESHKNLLKKEAIFFRPVNNSFKLKYLCTMCNISWYAK